ncbi:MAG TPA: hypothetical protein DHW39_05905 [Erysipelotrichaceae bacterium]|nr:hypothetical protein [Erysipelotrichaceae bacterium]
MTKTTGKYFDFAASFFLLFFTGRLMNNLGYARDENLPVKEVMGSPAMETLLWIAFILAACLTLKCFFAILNKKA